jgi:hypothetical protein
LKKTTRSILEELNSINIKKNNEDIIESRALHIIDGAINLLKLIKETYSEEESFELEKRLIGSIRTYNSAKFVRGIKRIKEDKETKKRLKVIDGNLKNDS